ncbi:MAG: hypothetical protein RLZZ332_1020 [Actinomycetota bacterium]
MHSCNRWVWLTTTLRVVRLVESLEHQLNFGKLGFECIKIDIEFSLVVVWSRAHERPW